MDKIDPAQETENIVTFLKTTFSKAGFTKTVIGVSGGIDSAVSCALAVKALGTENVYPLLLPYGPLNTQGVLDGMDLVNHLGIPFTNAARIDIKPPVDALAPHLGGPDQLRRGNIMVRMRMICLFDQAKRRAALVMGTENRTEHLLGYFTRFGDEASDVEPIRHLYKTQVYELAQYLGLPEKIISNPPTAGLWPEQTDEGEFGFTYRQADEILFLLVDAGKTAEEAAAAGIDRRVVEAVKMRMERNGFKHQTPYFIR